MTQFTGMQQPSLAPSCELPTNHWCYRTTSGFLMVPSYGNSTQHVWLFPARKENIQYFTWKMPRVLCFEFLWLYSVIATWFGVSEVILYDINKSTCVRQQQQQQQQNKKLQMVCIIIGMYRSGHKVVFHYQTCSFQNKAQNIPKTLIYMMCGHNFARHFVSLSARISVAIK